MTSIEWGIDRNLPVYTTDYLESLTAEYRTYREDGANRFWLTSTCLREVLERTREGSEAFARYPFLKRRFVSDWTLIQDLRERGQE